MCRSWAGVSVVCSRSRGASVARSRGQGIEGCWGTLERSVVVRPHGAFILRAGEPYGSLSRIVV